MNAAPASRAGRRPATKKPATRGTRTKSTTNTKKTKKRRGPGARRQAANRLRRRKILQRILISGGAVVVAVGLFVLIPLGLARDPAPICIDRPQTFPAEGIEGWSGEQLENAATIIRTAAVLGYAREGQILGVMTAMGESSLRNIDYGDWETRGFTNPDGTRTTSIGLFQQQEWWGSVEQRMDPATATTLFFDRLGRLPDWQTMEPSHAIHRVQINTDRDYYSRFQADATAVVDAMSGPCE
ncbi:hypothetical protein [Microbacterium sp.]|uniref:hypothetical protein n=1 Tax=Microbacterium sp. TaxID=51671 RepID=UPI0026397E5B|nr:hypothetical protein [Microbacterium sp.]MCV0334589.1 hypothetical protein [Microbacterium sp.]MCV0376225.1 hypothetical protein [Microbacterium sp.]MCV0389784.1 hypothetical protein [Microbacterium sp.]MCV0419319.1 hypothetical protein [Microbacterium sp.]MCV0421624.1 hypothetical protein [Microbacterium sp.]